MRGGGPSGCPLPVSLSFEEPTLGPTVGVGASHLVAPLPMAVSHFVLGPGPAPPWSVCVGSAPRGGCIAVASPLWQVDVLSLPRMSRLVQPGAGW